MPFCSNTQPTQWQRVAATGLEDGGAQEETTVARVNRVSPWAPHSSQLKAWFHCGHPGQLAHHCIAHHLSSSSLWWKHRESGTVGNTGNAFDSKGYYAECIVEEIGCSIDTGSIITLIGQQFYPTVKESAGLDVDQHTACSFDWCTPVYLGAGYIGPTWP